MMLARLTRTNDPAPEAEQPLLSNSLEDDESTGRTVFAIDDDSGDEESLHDAPRAVRFEEEVQVISPTLRSTVDSREAEFELDSDEGETAEQIGVHSNRSMPLLVGLLDASNARRSIDTPLPLVANGQSSGEAIDLQELASKRTAGGGMIDSIVNMANSILGAGIIGLPYAVSQAGLVTGLILLLVLCCVTDWTILLIAVNAKLSGRSSYVEILHHTFGPSGRAAISFFQFSFAFGGMCAYGIIIGDTIPHVIRFVFPKLNSTPVLSIFGNRQFIIILCTVSVSFPLSLYRDIHKLSRASGLALIGMVIIVISVLIEGPHVTPDLKGDPSKRFSIISPGIFQAIGVISFAFVCHHNSLLIYGSLRTPTLDRFAKVTHISTLISFVACATLAISAFLVFTDKTQGNVLNNFSLNDSLINFARFCFGMNMFTTLPLELFVCREVVEQYFFPHEAFSPQRHLFFTTTILFSSMLISLVTCDLGVMLEITGGVSATAIAFIFPAACYLKLMDPRPPWYSRAKLPAVVCTAFGFVVLVSSLGLALRKVWTPEGSAKICL